MVIGQVFIMKGYTRSGKVRYHSQMVEGIFKQVADGEAIFYYESYGCEGFRRRDAQSLGDSE